jgi:hypothetical protein
VPDSEPRGIALRALNERDLDDDLKPIAGSSYHPFNLLVLEQVLNTLRLEPSDPERFERQSKAMMAAMAGIAPRNEAEGMLAAQMVATYHAAMECHRRAMREGQTFEGRRENLNQAVKLTRTYAEMLEALDKHRGKGRQRITVRHVHVNNGGQAIVGALNRAGEHPNEAQGEPDAIRAIEYRPGEPMRRAERRRQRVPVPVNQDGRPVDHGGQLLGEAQGAVDTAKVIKFQPERPMPSAEPPREPAPAEKQPG